MERFALAIPLLALLLLTLVPAAMAAPRHIPVLSVAESNSTLGSVADVYLEVRPGSGAVYIDSFPLTKLDTQLSARFAREYACDLAARDCSSLDFFYIIRAQSSIIGGPSAGAAMTVLAYATLEDLPIDENTVVTGTINSGGLVGPVGGTHAKVQAAQLQGFDRVLVSALEYDPTLQNYGIRVIPVSDVEEAIEIFTGEDISGPAQDIVVPPQYTKTMEDIAGSLCLRAQQLADLTNASEQNRGYIAQAAAASGNGNFYTAASYCFTANLDLRAELLENRSQAELRHTYRELERDIAALDESMPDEFTNVADLEVFMIVRERLLEAQEVLDDQDYANLSAERVAYALERYNSGLAWSAFFGALPSRQMRISDVELARSCQTKLAEAEERINYISYLTAVPLEETRQQLQSAFEYRRQEEYALCLYSASKAKAEADSVLSTAYVGSELNGSVQTKIEKARELLARSTAEDTFPIISYSYYQYARDLDNPYSANLYAEYALQLGSLDIYFPPRRTVPPLDTGKVLLLLAGAIMGFSAGVLAHESLTRHRSRRRKDGRGKATPSAKGKGSASTTPRKKPSPARRGSRGETSRKKSGSGERKKGGQKSGAKKRSGNAQRAAKK